MDTNRDERLEFDPKRDPLQRAFEPAESTPTCKMVCRRIDFAKTRTCSTRTDTLDTLSELDDIVGSLPEFERQTSRFDRQISGVSKYSSMCSSFATFAEPSQTLIFFDWDDTLFPTTDFFDRLGFTHEGFPDESRLDAKLRSSLKAWREALRLYLQEALKLSANCTIITNSKRPWVDLCIDNFIPEIKHFFGDGGITVVYASEQRKKRYSHHSRHRSMTHEEHEDQQTMAKYRAMKEVAVAFYSQYPEQSWKNILSIGDMQYERDAVKEVTFKRNPAFKERVRTKTLVLPTSPTLTEITLRLRFSRLMLPAYVHFDGDFDLDLSRAEDPLEAIAEALRIPELAAVPFSRHAWGRGPLQQKDVEVSDSLADVAFTVHDAMFS
mmetsp:Transcript_90440/g.193933  ORF Transcript_90440/g.193933 Transcript_90440/m.193933 type:complete len:381 (+) Transcript_90440:168-1310(+)